MAFSTSNSFSLLFLISFLLPSLVLVASSSEVSNSCNFDYVFTFGVPETYVMNQDFYLSHQETGFSYLDEFLDLFVGLSMEKCMEKLEKTLIIINHPGLMDYKQPLQVGSEFIVLDLVQETVAKIKNALPILDNAGSWNIVVSGLKPGALFGELHRDYMYQAVEELPVEFPIGLLQVPEGCQAFLEHKGHLL